MGLENTQSELAQEQWQQIQPNKIDRNDLRRPVIRKKAFLPRPTESNARPQQLEKIHAVLDKSYAAFDKLFNTIANDSRILEERAKKRHPACKEQKPVSMVTNLPRALYFDPDSLENPIDKGLSQQLGKRIFDDIGYAVETITGFEHTLQDGDCFIEHLYYGTYKDNPAAKFLLLKISPIASLTEKQKATLKHRKHLQAKEKIMKTDQNALAELIYHDILRNQEKRSTTTGATLKKQEYRKQRKILKQLAPSDRQTVYLLFLQQLYKHWLTEIQRHNAAYLKKEKKLYIKSIRLAKTPEAKEQIQQAANETLSQIEPTPVTPYLAQLEATLKALHAAVTEEIPQTPLARKLSKLQGVGAEKLDISSQSALLETASGIKGFALDTIEDYLKQGVSLDQRKRTVVRKDRTRVEKLLWKEKIDILGQKVAGGVYVDHLKQAGNELDDGWEGKYLTDRYTLIKDNLSHESDKVFFEKVTDLLQTVSRYELDPTLTLNHYERAYLLTQDTQNALLELFALQEERQKEEGLSRKERNMVTRRGECLNKLLEFTQAQHTKLSATISELERTREQQITEALTKAYNDLAPYASTPSFTFLGWAHFNAKQREAQELRQTLKSELEKKHDGSDTPDSFQLTKLQEAKKKLQTYLEEPSAKKKQIWRRLFSRKYRAFLKKATNSLDSLKNLETTLLRGSGSITPSEQPAGSESSSISRRTHVGPMFPPEAKRVPIMLNKGSEAESNPFSQRL